VKGEDRTLPLFSPPPRACRSRPRLSGRAAADAPADPAWTDGALSAITQMARTGRTFQAYDVAKAYRLPDPPKTCWWGSVFARAHREGLIVRVGAIQSTRRTVNSSLTTLWRGADDLHRRSAGSHDGVDV
jgi:hypothetical protein